jgi:hypothetical protein
MHRILTVQSKDKLDADIIELSPLKRINVYGTNKDNEITTIATNLPC